MSESKPQDVKIGKRLEVKRFTIKSFGISTNLRTGILAPTATCVCIVTGGGQNCANGTGNGAPTACVKSACAQSK